MLHEIVNNLNHIKAEIAKTFAFHYLLPKSTHIIAVSKNQPIEKIMPLLQSGHRIFGENKVLEAVEKWTPLKEQYPDIKLHHIGHLQTNKIKKALTIFDVFQTIDRPAVVDELIKNQSMITNKQFFIQINTGNEPQKSGVMLDGFSTLLEITKQKKLPITGLMCIPPVNENPLKHFLILQSIARQNGQLNISAGMSSDYHKAILAGTDYVRIGTKIFEEST
jgi:pyridoxal phosphate enzyme (YggS family)